MDGFGSVLMPFPDEGWMWYCGTHKAFGLHHDEDECFVASELHCRNNLPDAVNIAIEYLRVCLQSDLSQESMAAVGRSVIDRMKEWPIYSESAHELLCFDGTESGLSDLIARLEMMECDVFMLNVQDALNAYDESPDDAVRLAAQRSIPLLVAAGEIVETNRQTQGSGLAEEIEAWLNGGAE